MSSTPLSSTTTDRTDSVILFCGDSGDGIQLLGHHFTSHCAKGGYFVSTFPSFPAEIRAPRGSPHGVSSFQVHMSVETIHTPGEEVDILVAFNPAGLKEGLKAIKKEGLVVLDTGQFTPRQIEKAGFHADPRKDGCLNAMQTIELDITHHTLNALSSFKVSRSQALTCRNFWILGFLLSACHHSLKDAKAHLEKKFPPSTSLYRNNLRALTAGAAFFEVSELPLLSDIPPLKKGKKNRATRQITGAEALSLGLCALRQELKKSVIFCSYPITPASLLLHQLSRYQHYGVTTLQAEDEIAAICTAIGCSYAGGLGVTASAGPGMSLKTEALGFALMADIPLIVINAQRPGPSTGMPTKTAQGDLLQALYGRHGDAPLPVLSMKTPDDGFYKIGEAARIALTFSTPVILLTDSYTCHASYPWTPPATLPSFSLPLKSYHRLPGTKNSAPYIIGGLEQDINTTAVSSDPKNHALMNKKRADKLCLIAKTIKPATLAAGSTENSTLLISWGSGFGICQEATLNLRTKDHDIAHLCLEWLSPLAPNLHVLTKNFHTLIIAEMNKGQLAHLLKATLSRPLISYTQADGRLLSQQALEQFLLTHIT